MAVGPGSGRWRWVRERWWACDSASRKRGVRLWRDLCESGGPLLSALSEASTSPWAQVCGAPSPQENPSSGAAGVDQDNGPGLPCSALSLPLGPCGHENRRGSSGCHLGGWPPCALCPAQAHPDDSGRFPRLPSGVLLAGPRTEAGAVKWSLVGVAVGAARCR